MRTHAIVRVCAVCIVGLLLGVPLSTPAQQATSNAAGGVDRAAKAAAERDAQTDFNNRNKLSWAGIGSGLPVIGCALGVAGCLIGTDIYVALTPDGSLPLGCCVGYTAACTAAGLLGIYSLPAAPPAERLLGKSPAYIAFYTDAYTQQKRLLRLSWTAVGTAISFGALMLWVSKHI